MMYRVVKVRVELATGEVREYISEVPEAIVMREHDSYLQIIVGKRVEIRAPRD